MELGPFPVDDLTLDALEHALGASLDWPEGADAPELVGADFSLSTLLDFLSGYDPTRVRPLIDSDGFEVPDTVEYTGGPLYHPNDVIRALIAEVRRLRGKAELNG